MKVAELRDENGKLPAYAWPGAYPLVYITKSGTTLCPSCANDWGEYGPDPAYSRDPVVEGDVHWEGPPIECGADGCSNDIESAYGDPDEDDLPSPSPERYASVGLFPAA